MHNRPQNILTLIAVLALAVALTAAMSGGVVARSTFQSSIQQPTDVPLTPISTVTGPAVPTVQPITTPVPVAPTSEPAPTDVVGGLTPTVPGFLPPPTLTNPNDLVPGRSSPLRPSGQSPLVGPTVRPPEATAGPAAPAAVSGPAQLIDSGVVALSYLWLCCGALGLAAAALVLVWLARRSKRR